MKKYLSYSIIVTITLFVFGYSGFIFLNSVTDPHSNVQMIGQYGKQAIIAVNNQLSENVQADSISEPSPSSTPTTSSSPTLTPEIDPGCSTLSKVTLYNTLSLVDYLTQTQRPSTFLDRSPLAVKYDLRNYQGTSDQNLLILAILMQQDYKTVCTKV